MDSGCNTEDHRLSRLLRTMIVTNDDDDDYGDNDKDGDVCQETMRNRRRIVLTVYPSFDAQIFGSDPSRLETRDPFSRNRRRLLPSAI